MMIFEPPPPVANKFESGDVEAVKRLEMTFSLSDRASTRVERAAEIQLLQRFGV